jgi:hypothetical protein
MDTLVGATQHIGIHNLGEFSKFYCKFCTIIEYLAKQNRISTCKIATNFLCALPADLQQKIIFCIQICDPNRHVDKLHTLKLLFEAGVHILEGTTILDTMNPYAAAMAYMQPQSQAGQMHQPVQQAQVNYPQNMYIPGTSISSPYGFYAPLVVPSPQFPYAQQTVPVHQAAPPAAQPNTFQPLPYTPGLKQEDIMTITTMVASVFAKQPTPLFQQQPHGNATTNIGQKLYHVYMHILWPSWTRNSQLQHCADVHYGKQHLTRKQQIGDARRFKNYAKLPRRSAKGLH